MFFDFADSVVPYNNGACIYDSTNAAMGDKELPVINGTQLDAVNLGYNWLKFINKTSNLLTNFNQTLKQ